MQDILSHAESEKYETIRNDAIPVQAILPHIEPEKSGEFINDVAAVLQAIPSHVQSEKSGTIRKDDVPVEAISPHIEPEKSGEVINDAAPSQVIAGHVEKKSAKIRKIACQDGYNWRQFGKRADKEKNCIVYYYRCTYNDCKAKKRLQGPNDTIIDIIYDGAHDHPKPQPKPHQKSFSKCNDQQEGRGKSVGEEDKSYPPRWFS